MDGADVLMMPTNNVLYFNENIDVRMALKNGHTSLISFWKMYKHKNIESTDTSYTKTYAITTSRVFEIGSFDNVPFRKDSCKIAVYRDPIERFLSAYYEVWDHAIGTNRYKHLPDIDNNWCDMDWALSLIESNTCPINYHLQPQSFWLGDKNQYDKLYHLRELRSLLEFLHTTTNSICDPEIVNTRINKSSEKDVAKLKVSDLTSKQKLRIMKIYAIDYANGWCE